jgi:hypothetical protein
VTTRPRASPGNAGGLSAPGAPGLARPLSRGGAAEAAPPTPGGCPRYRPAGGGPPLRALWHPGCHSARVRRARPTAPRIVLPVQITVKGAPCGRVC